MVRQLQNVNSAITRGQFAKLMATLYWTVWEEGSPMPEYEEGVVTDCGSDDYDQYLMVALGLMEAPNGKFNPNGKLTEAEAIQIIYHVVAKSNPSILDDTQGVFCVQKKDVKHSYSNSYLFSRKYC